VLADGIHAGFDKHRSKFFLVGVGDKCKQYWVNWAKVCQPKDQGGLGIINTKIMNIALMMKWFWCLFMDNPENTLWHRIIRTKYPGVGGIFSVKPHGESPFWHSLHKIKDFFSRWGARFSLGNS
jgi:hypothetical protein